ncbi:MAG TPA: hypothetical protein V6D33_14105 [Cyanophyceae cyanobacterium]
MNIAMIEESTANIDSNLQGTSRLGVRAPPFLPEEGVLYFPETLGLT